MAKKKGRSNLWWFREARDWGLSFKQALDVGFNRKKK
jgi:hypothetical protein